MIENKTENLKKEVVVDDLETKPKVDEAKLAALKEMAAKKRAAETNEKEQDVGKEESMPIQIVARKHSLVIGVVGTGFCGGNLASEWYSRGYPAVVINTAPQDLSACVLPEGNKLLLDHGLGGCAKDVSLGHESALAYKEVITDLIEKKLGDCNVIVLCTSLGGGSGAGSVEVLTEVISTLGKPLVIMGVLPKASEDVQLKSNSILTLSKLTKFFNSGKVDNIIIADNSKMESIFSDVSPFNFYNICNKEIVETIDVFNTMSRRNADGVKVLDSTEFGKLFIDGKGFTVYGQLKVENYTDEMAIATSIVESLDGNLLASGFDIRQARYAGFMIVANPSVWDKIPSSSLDFAQHMINDSCDNPLAVFHGIYKDDIKDDAVFIYSMYSGLGLPQDRVDQLKNEVQQKMAVSQKKDDNRKMTMKIDVGESSVTKAEEIRKKIQQNGSSFGKLHSGLVQDRRKR